MAPTLEIFFGLVLALGLIKAVKHGELGPRTTLVLEDWAAALFLAGLLGAAWSSPIACALLAALSCSLLIALWLDALLFRVFTIELGAGGVKSVVISVLYRELAELSLARRFLGQHRAFAVLPLAAILLHLPLFLEPRGIPIAVLAAYFVFARATAGAVIALAGLLLAALFELAVPPSLAASIGLLALAASARPSLIRSFLFARPHPIAKDHRARDEHERFLELAPSAPKPSDLFARLRGADVILVTVESMSRVHLPRMPYFDSLAGLRSGAHFCISPTTNNAHRALYFSAYSHGPSLVKAFAREGYRTIYVSPIHSEHYGLRAILDRAGFDHVLDRTWFRPHALDGGVLSDWALPEQAPELIAELGSGPRFIHVQTVNTHVPYRVVDRRRFGRRDPKDDLSRYLDGLEEADAIAAELIQRLSALGGSHPIVAITGDHGQSFGRLGYHSHGSAIVRDQIDVPIVIQHPDLPPRAVPWSSHFDVLPTLLELAGVSHAEPCFGASMLVDRAPELFLWAGTPSRSTTSNYGLVLGARKYMVDLVTEKSWESDWSEEDRRELSGAEKVYWDSLLSKMLLRFGLR